MINIAIPNRLRRSFERNQRFAFRPPLVAVLIAGLGLLAAPPPLQAQTVAELQAANAQLAAENARLKEALEQSQKTGTAAPSTTVTAPAAPEAAPRATITTAATPVAAKRSNQSPGSAVGSEPSIAATSVTDKKDVTVKLDAVIVTAEQDIKEIPKSISVVTGPELNTFHVDNFRDIVSRIGDVRTSWQNPNSASIFIRGVGWASGAGALDPSVGVVVDGVSNGVSAITALSNFTDIESVSVTRGPQGVDGAKSSSVGRVTITPKPPSFTPVANLELTLGQLRNVTGSATLGGPIEDGLLAYRVSIHRETADGPFSNKNDTANTYRNTDRTNARVQFLLTPSRDLEAKLSIDITPTGREMCENCFNFNVKTPAFYDNLDANGNRIAVDYSNDAYGKLQRRWFAQNTSYTLGDYYSTSYVDRIGDYPNTYATKGVALNLKSKFDSDVTLTSITAFRDYRFSQGIGSLTGFDWSLPPGGSLTTYRQYSQELKLDWQVSRAWKAQAGLHYFVEDYPNVGNITRYGPDAGAWYANAAQYAILDPVNPQLPNATDTAGWDLLKNSADGLITQSKSKLYNPSAAAYSNVIWTVDPQLTLSAGLRATREERSFKGSSFIQSNGFASELNPVSVNNVQLNGFANDAKGNLTAANNDTQLALADFVAQKYFSAVNYSALTATQKLQVATAKAIRLARIGALYQQTKAQGYNATLPTGQLGATYKLSDSQSVYASWSHGEKAGVSQLSGATVLGGKSVPVGTERSEAYDLGIKSLFFNDTLIVDGTLYLQDIHNYIQNGVLYDAVQTQLNNNGQISYLSALINVPRVQTKGVELNVSYTGIQHTILRINGAYTDARYKDFQFAADPWELGGNPNQHYTDQTGHVLAGAPKFSGNLFANYSYPLGGKVLHANANYNFQTGYYSDTSLSRYLFTKSMGVTDINVGIGRKDGKFDISLLVKNALNVNTDINVGSPGSAISLKPGIPRWAGVVLNAEY